MSVHVINTLIIMQYLKYIISVVMRIQFRRWFNFSKNENKLIMQYTDIQRNE